MKRVALAMWLSACGSDYPDSVMVQAKINSGAAACLERVLSEAQAPAWLQQFEAQYASELTMAATQDPTDSTSGYPININVVMPTGDFFRYSSDFQYKLKLEIKFGTHRYVSSLYEEPPPDGHQRFSVCVDKVFCVTTANTVLRDSTMSMYASPGYEFCQTDDLHYEHTHTYGISNNRLTEEKMSLRQGADEWLAFTNPEVAKGTLYDPSSRGVACHNNRCSGYSNLTLDPPAFRFRTPVPAFVTKLVEFIQNQRDVH